MLKLDARDGHIPAASRAKHADIASNALYKKQIIAAGMLFLHFEPISDLKSNDLHASSSVSSEKKAGGATIPLRIMDSSAARQKRRTVPTVIRTLPEVVHGAR
jgi:hypothetical protein